MNTKERLIIINIIDPKIQKLDPKNIFEIRRGPYFPLGVATIGSYLKKNIPDLPLLILDDQLVSIDGIKEKIKKFKPTIVAIGSVFTSYEKSLILAREAKKAGAKVVMGGHYPSSIPEVILNNRGPKSKDHCVDVIICGSGEKALCQYIVGKKISEISNIVYCKKNSVIKNEVKMTPLSKIIVDKKLIDPTIYFKEYHRSFPNAKYKNPFIIYSQKGCAWRTNADKHCLFCSLMHDQYILKNPKTVWSEINNLVTDYGVDYIWETSDDLPANKDWFNQFYKESKKYKDKPSLKVQSRVNHLTDEKTVKMLANLKVYQLFVGIESNDDDCLKLMNKGTTSIMNEKAVNLLIKYEVPIKGYFIIGNKGETKQSLQKTVRLAEKIANASCDNLVIPSFLTPLPNSESFEEIKNNTARKYVNKDIIDWKEIIADWVKYNSKVSNQDLLKTLRYLRSLSKNINAYSF